MTVSKSTGFSLIELLVVVGIVAIVVASAAPAWKSHLLATRRIDATSSLLHLAARQEQFRLQNRRYAAGNELPLDPPLGLGIANAPGGRYQLAVTVNNNSYTASAAAIANASQAEDLKCRTFGIDNLGRRWANGADGEDTTAVCWKN